jgi:hypothetical protein
MWAPGTLVITVGAPKSANRWPDVCGPRLETTPRLNVVYTVRESFRDEYGDASIRLCEIVNEERWYDRPGLPPSKFEPYWLSCAFRPLSDSRIAIFRQMLAPSPEKERA